MNIQSATQQQALINFQLSVLASANEQGAQAVETLLKSVEEVSQSLQEVTAASMSGKGTVIDIVA